MGFGFPRAERDGLVASDPETFFLPPDRRPALPVGLRPPRPARRRGDARAGHRRLADVHAADAARPARAAGAQRMRRGTSIERQEWHDVRPLLHPYVHFDDGDVRCAGRDRVLDHLRPPDAAAADRGRGARRPALPLGAREAELVGRPSIWVWRPDRLDLRHGRRRTRPLAGPLRAVAGARGRLHDAVAAWPSSRRTAPTTSEWPGEFPFTRGLYPTGYRGRTWTIRQFAGFGNAQQTNERYKMILGRGGGGLSVAFDMPTLMGRDSDDPKSLGEVGHCGVAIDSAADMERAVRRHRPRRRSPRR